MPNLSQPSLLNDIEKMLCPDGTMRIPDNLDVFAGHFPSNPILPGIYSLQVALYYLQLNLHQRVKLHSIQRCKFNTPLLPGMLVHVETKLGPRTENLQNATVLLFSQDQPNAHPISEVHLIVEIMPETGTASR